MDELSEDGVKVNDRSDYRVKNEGMGDRSDHGVKW